MSRSSEQSEFTVDPDANPPCSEAAGVVQITVWLLGISPMVWRRVLVPNACTLRELHGVIQVAMGWEGIHLCQFCLRSRRYGSWEASASSPDVTLAALRLRKGAQFTYEYDLNIALVSIQDHVESGESVVIPSVLRRFAGVIECGQWRTGVGMTAASCVTRVT